jgi:hypothetical protein
MTLPALEMPLISLGHDDLSILSTHCGANLFGSGAKFVVGQVRKHVFPQWQHHPVRFEHSEWARQHPDVEVGTTIAPAIEVDPGGVTQRQDPSLDFRDDPTEVRRHIWREVAEGVVVLSRLEPDCAAQTSADRWVQ